MEIGVDSSAVKAGYHHGDLRRALLTAAAALLEGGGPEALSLRAVARDAGVSPRAPYRHFADREELLSALAAQAFADFAAVLASADAGSTVDHAIEAQAIAYVRFALAAPARFRLMFGPRRVSPGNRLASAKASAFGVLEDRVTRDAVRHGDARARAVGLWAMAHGLAVLFLDERIRDEIDGGDDEIVRRVTAAVLSSAC